MVTWDDAQATCQDLSGDNSSSSLTFFKRMMNVGYKYVLAELGRPVTERTQTANSVTNQQAYQLPPDFLFAKSVVYISGSTKYPVVEEESQEYWDYLNLNTQNGIPQVYFIRPRFGFSGAEILFYPRPSENGTNNILVVYEATDKDLSVDKYTTGTVNVTAGSATVAGAGTTWTKPMEGRYFKVTAASAEDGLYYRVLTRNGDTSLTLENVYEGETQTGVTYEIVEIFNLPEEMQILPVYFALHHYFAGRKDQSRYDDKYFTLFREGLELAKRRHGTKTRSSIIRPKNWLTRWGYNYPAYFPSGGISS
ncbi:MAG: hypothetical protein QXW38_08405 [Candidatus Nitrosotenuis sp.]